MVAMLALLANAATNFVQAGMRRLRCVWLDTHAERALAVGWVFEGERTCHQGARLRALIGRQAAGQQCSGGQEG